MSRWRFFTDVELGVIRDLMPQTIMAIEVAGEQSRRRDDLIRRADEMYQRLQSPESASEYLARHQSVPGRMSFTVLETKG